VLPSAGGGTRPGGTGAEGGAGEWISAASPRPAAVSSSSVTWIARIASETSWRVTGASNSTGGNGGGLAARSVGARPGSRSGTR
jgi:hypothetical protein